MNTANLTNLVIFPITFKGEVQYVKNWKTLVEKLSINKNSFVVDVRYENKRRLNSKSFEFFTSFLIGTEYEMFLYKEILYEYYKYLTTLQIHPNPRWITVGQIEFYEKNGMNITESPIALNSHYREYNMDFDNEYTYTFITLKKL